MKILILTLLFPFFCFAQLEEKSLGMLKADLAKIEKNIEVTKQKMKEIRSEVFLPDLYFVLAELHADKSRYLYVITRQSNKKKPIEELDFSDSTKAKKQAIEVYQRYIENFPKGDSLDKAYFYMAHSYRELGQIEQMVQTYMKITKDYLKSPYWGESQLILGDYFLEQKKDPKMASEFFQKILDRPPTVFTPLARFRLGRCYVLQSKFYEAMLAYEGVIQVDRNINLDNLPEIYKKTDLRQEALVQLVWPYSEVKDLDSSRAQALPYFERMIENRETLLKVLTALSRRLNVKKRYDQAVPVGLRLLEITNETGAQIKATEDLYDAYKQSKKDWPLDGINNLLAQIVIKARSSDKVTANQKGAVEKNFELIMRDFATKQQKKAQASRQEVDYRKAIASYEDYMSVFGRARYSSPMVLNLAESYFAVKAHSQAGKFYEILSKRPMKGNRKNIYDSAIQSYALALKNADNLSRVEVAEARQGFRDLGQAFVRQYPRDPANPMILFNIGRTFYDERDFEQAVVRFRNFINTFPGHKETTTAGQLILDSYNQREDYEGLIRAGKELIASPKITNAQFKSEVSEIIKQAEYRKIQDQVGDPRSREYAKKLLSFASKYQGSSLGDQALFEAFTSFKNKKDPQMYEPGEQLLTKHADSKYAKEVVGSMGQMALNTADYRRAAKYFEIYARKYPKEAESSKLLSNAAKMRELMGDFREAAEDYRDMGQSEQAAGQYILAQEWMSAAQILSARAQSSLKGNYWLGLSMYRQGNREQARPYLERAFKGGANSFEEKTMAAHSLYLTAGLDLKAYQAIQLGQGDEAAAVKNKQAQLGKLSSKMNQVIQFGNGRWTIAALYELGRANDEFAQFLSRASVPAGLSPDQQAQYRNIVAGQVNQYQNKARSFYASCVSNAEKFEVFTGFVRGCQSMGSQVIDEAVEERLKAKASDTNPVGTTEVRRKLFDNPKDINLLMSLGNIYLQGQDYSMARLIYSRVLELSPRNSLAEAMTGVTQMYMNDFDAAANSFRLSLKHKGNEAVALFGMAALYKNFGFKSRAPAAISRVKAIAKPKLPLHPWMTAL